MQLQDYLNQLRAIIHDTNSADFTNATLINFINQARTRVAMDTHCVRGFLSVTGGNALNTVTQKENYSYAGTVGGVTVNTGGTNYTNPAISFTGGGGTGAAASAIVINGAITNINMTNWGVNYSSAPTVVITDSTGTGATATATALINVLDILSITIIWGDQRIVCEWMPFTMFQAFCRQYVNQFSTPSVFTMHQGILQFFLFQIPDQAYTMEADIITLPTPLVNLADTDNQIISPWNDAVQYYAAFLAIASLQNYSQAKFWYEPKGKSGIYDTRILQLPATSFSRRIYNPYRTFMKRLKRM